MIWMQKGLDALALVYAILFFPAPFFWLIFHPFIGFWRRLGSRSFWIAVPVWLVWGTALVFLRHDIFAERINRNALTWILGTALIVLALWINRRVHREFSVRRLIGLPEMHRQRDPAGMIRSGIYGQVRHPRYLEFMLTFLALAFLTGAVGIFLLAIVTILMYLIVAPLEERELREYYGSEYEAYARTAPRFVPRLRRKTKTEISS